MVLTTILRVLLFIQNRFQFFSHVLPANAQDDALHAAMMVRADTVVVCSLPLAKNSMHSPTSIAKNRAYRKSYVYGRFRRTGAIHRAAVRTSCKCACAAL